VGVNSLLLVLQLIKVINNSIAVFKIVVFILIGFKVCILNVF